MVFGVPGKPPYSTDGRMRTSSERFGVCASRTLVKSSRVRSGQAGKKQENRDGGVTHGAVPTHPVSDHGRARRRADQRRHFHPLSATPTSVRVPEHFDEPYQLASATHGSSAGEGGSCTLRCVPRICRIGPFSQVKSSTMKLKPLRSQQLLGEASSGSRKKTEGIGRRRKGSYCS
eukprot:COSAG04_NODE_64_length_29689_cov_158.096992_9_plen_175_part_00